MPSLRRILVVATLAAAAGGGLGQSVPAPRRTGSAPVAISRAALLDINTATAAELKALPGMGAEYARRIIAGRPYSAKNQLVSRGILPQAAYEEIAGRIVARRQK
jgi:DNA uptake protein ComE-like DNA-binding protein